MYELLHCCVDRSFSNIVGHEKKNPGGTQAQKNRSKRNLDYVMFNDDSCVDFFEDAQPNLPKTKGRAPGKLSSFVKSKYSIASVQLEKK